MTTNKNLNALLFRGELYEQPSHLCLNTTLVLLGYFLLHFALHEVIVVEGVGDELGLVVEPQVHVVPVHHRPQHVSTLEEVRRNGNVRSSSWFVPVATTLSTSLYFLPLSLSL